MGDVHPKIASSSAVMLVLPGRAFANPETADDNAFQFEAEEAPDTLQTVWGEVLGFAAELAKAGVRVVVHRAQCESPDAVFPNNWFSTHPGGMICLYSMRSPLRRTEREVELVAGLGRAYPVALDFTTYEGSHRYLEGTGSLVLDRRNRVVYAGESQRTDLGLAAQWAEAMDYRLVAFHTRYDAMPVYHTNVVMAVGDKWAVVCSDVIEDGDRDVVLSSLRETGHEIIEISGGQLAEFCGNIYELETPSGPVIAMSTRAWAGFNLIQKKTLREYGRLIHAPLEQIEKIGGGSARCMIAELAELSDEQFRNLEKIVPRD